MGSEVRGMHAAEKCCERQPCMLKEGQEQCPSAARPHLATAAGRGPAPVCACRSRVRRASDAANVFERLEPLLMMPGRPSMSGSSWRAARMMAASPMAAWKPAQGEHTPKAGGMGGGSGGGGGGRGSRGRGSGRTLLAHSRQIQRLRRTRRSPAGPLTLAGLEGAGVSCSVAAEVPAAVEQKLTLGFELCGPQLPTAAMPAQLPRRLCAHANSQP